MKPPLIVAEAGLRLVSGPLEKTKVSALAIGAEKIAIDSPAIAMTIELFLVLILFATFLSLLG